MRVATYNILVADYGKSIDKIADEIKSHNIDIIGIQEVDLNVKRSGNIDVLKLLSEKSGLEHYHFFPTIPIQEGYYGIGILSKYPIFSANLIKYECFNLEKRVLGSVTIKVDGKTVHFFNTHLSYEDYDVRAGQIKLIQKSVSEKTPFIITGDFNIKGFDELYEIKGTLLNNEKNKFITFKGDSCNKNGFYSIDNIIVSNDYKVIYVNVFPSESSDHEMFIADIELSD